MTLGQHSADLRVFKSEPDEEAESPPFNLLSRLYILFGNVLYDLEIRRRDISRKTIVFKAIDYLIGSRTKSGISLSPLRSR
jgi:hypothetical protein